ncbi:MAG TPA: helix-turn-helix transcriptional regulator [Longimicrobium sp.]|jgi:predicted XRE-type DNA-binding protein|uniref:helix-turn-helix domain-containing protein n=1 Tax=Longimicrobium sp. TaxID=2029185 RepID=UPI002ED8C9FB
MSDELPEFYVSSGNIWADIGRPDAEEAFARCQLMSRVCDLIRERRLTQKRAAEILGTNQPTVSDLMRGKLSKFSLERLIGFLTALGQEVEISVRPRPAGSDQPALTVATAE